MEPNLKSQRIKKLEALELVTGRTIDDIVNHAIEAFHLESIVPSEIDWKKFDFLPPCRTGSTNKQSTAPWMTMLSSIVQSFRRPRAFRDE
jgi:hypothetical protein